MYHGIILQPLPVSNWCQLDVHQFEEQIKFLTLEYRIFPLREVIDRLERGLCLPARTVVLTFDDGFRSVCTTAFPILERYQVPFTVFLVTGLVGSNQHAWPERLFLALAAAKRDSVTFKNRRLPLTTPAHRTSAYYAIGSQLKAMDVGQKDEALELLLSALGTDGVAAPAFDLMSWEDIRSLSRTGLTDFGSHTQTHQILSRCQPDRQEDELRNSRDTLLQQIGMADLFAYPNGTADDFTQFTKRLLKELNYRCGLTTIRGLNQLGSDLYELRRVGVGSGTSLADYELMMLGY